MAKGSRCASIQRRDGDRLEIGQAEILPAVKDGALVRVPGALRRLGVLDEIAETILGAVRDCCGGPLADAVRARGLERIHEVLDGAQIEATLHEAHARLGPRYPSFAKAIGVEVLGRKRAFYVYDTAVLRVLAPHEVAARNAERFTQKQNLGRLDPHAPHRDTWFGVPPNAINLWLAVGAAEEENGLSVYPDAWRVEVEQDGRYVRRDQVIGVPLRLACDAGDLALFHSRHLHGAVLNTTGSARVTVTMRLCVEPPMASTVGGLGGRWLYSPLVGTRFERYAGAATRLSWSRLTRRLRRSRRGDSRLPMSATKLPVATADPGKLAEGQIAALDRDRCAARIDGRILVFGRRCPHENADFAAGYVKDGRVHCPWHDYWIDPATGRGPCEALAPVPTYPEERLRAS